jgi:hypothetical protein
VVGFGIFFGIRNAAFSRERTSLMETVFTYVSEDNIVEVKRVTDFGYQVIQRQGEYDTNPIIATAYGLDTAMDYARKLIGEDLEKHS